MKSRNFIVHDLNQGIQLAEMAAKSSIPITIFSPPGGGSSIGPEAFLEIVNLIRSKFPEVKMLAILDCGDDAGVALAAMRRGLNNIHSQLTGEKLKKLKQIALTNGVKIHTKPKNVIDLESVKNFAYKNIDHSSIVKKTRKRNWYSEDMFTRFAVRKIIINQDG